ncbi:zinc finger CCHC domain-containing protein 8 [Sardina pilchardus]|uniref:zinc finger CCHC domain-containing protein 8 n=1 Tax=Sardina pilchardus TaxID=27697 RepID=UPI002E14372A
MAEVDFGDSELFEQLDDERPVATHLRFETDEDGPEETQEFQERLEECEETISRLNAENEELRRKLKTLTRPSGLKVDNTRSDGPLLHILYGNNNISKECRQEIEDSICSLIQKHQQKNVVQPASSYVPPQTSSFFLEDEPRDKSPDTIKKIKEAFSVVGSVLYFTSFCLDKLGQPLLNENPQLTDGWEVPTYAQVFSNVMTLVGQEVQVKEKRPKPCCFNCGGEDHQLRDCPKPKDMARINEKRKEFSHGNNNQLSSQRYHFEELEERFNKYKPGVVSKELLDALGVSVNKLPPFVYRMRELGYPPGWLKEAEDENSGLQLYDGNASGEVTEEENGHSQKVSYDLSKLVDFPGFNVGLPAHVKDEHRAYGSIPMQYQHMKQNFAAYLSTNYPTSGSPNAKRRHESESTPRHSKKRRSGDTSRHSDMDLESDQGSPRPPWTPGGFQFQPPLPPNSPSFSSPPPLPPGTPPITPTPPPLPKGTPPANGSPALEREESEDGLTLEELEEQQRLLWAALEKADTATNSDSETAATGTPVPSSPSVSTPARPDAEMEEETSSRNDEDTPASPEKATIDTPASPETTPMDTPASPEEVQITTPASPEEVQIATPVSPEEVQIATPVSPEEVQIATPVSPEEAVVVKKPSAQQATVVDKVVGDVEMVDECGNGGAGVQQAAEQSTPQSPTDEGIEEPEVKKVVAVPHRSKFATGIVPFEETPEYTEVAEATGTYLKIRDLLKCSPRNQAKNKK